MNCFNLSEIPLRREVDVLVAGGGSAGMCAAIAAARTGANTLLVEANGFLGGTATAGLMVEFGPMGNQRERIVGGIPHELVHRLIDLGAAIQTPEERHNTTFDPEYLKLLGDRMTREAGVRLRYHTQIIGVHHEGMRVAEVIVASKSGLERIPAKVFVDCTGDADVSAWAGAPFEKGRPKDGLMQPVSLEFLVGGIQVEPFEEFRRAPKTEPWEVIERARAAGDFPIEIGRFSSYGAIPRYGKLARDGEGVYFVNASRVHNIDGTNVEDLTRAEVIGREQVHALVAFMRRYLPGCQGAYLESSGAYIGVRETRRVLGEYVLTADDIVGTARFPDVVARACNQIDVHDPDGRSFHLVQLKPGESYDIPYRCLVARNVANLLVAGRCISTTHEANGSIRVMVVTMPVGEAAGTAAALVAQRGVPARELDVALLQATLLAHGVDLGREARTAAGQRTGQG